VFEGTKVFLRKGVQTNEHKGSLVSLKNLLLKNRFVVGDEMFCQRDVCEQVLEAGGDYLFSLKENQSNLLRDIELEFNTAPAPLSFVSARQAPHAIRERTAEQQTVSTLDKCHGRLEKRSIATTTALKDHLN